MKYLKKWIAAALIRAVRTFAQTFGGAITIGAALSEIDWRYIASVAAVAAVYSVLMSLAGLPEVKMTEAKPEEREETDGPEG